MLARARNLLTNKERPGRLFERQSEKSPGKVEIPEHAARCNVRRRLPMRHAVSRLESVPATSSKFSIDLDKISIALPFLSIDTRINGLSNRFRRLDIPLAGRSIDFITITTSLSLAAFAAQSVCSRGTNRLPPITRDLSKAN